MAAVLAELRFLRGKVDSMEKAISSTSVVESTSQPPPTIPAAPAPLAAAQHTVGVGALGGSPLGQAINSNGKRISSSLVPEIDIVPPNVKKDILLGKDINLAVLLLPLHERQHASHLNGEIQVGDDTFILKAKRDNRMNINLTIGDFVKAFNIYKNVIVEEQPGRRAELDAYLSNMIRMASQFPGFIYYNYHREFSARAADLWINHNIPLDWSELDPRIASRHTAGCKANACSICQSHDHSTDFCASFASRKPAYPRQSLPQLPAKAAGVKLGGDAADGSKATRYCWRFNGNNGCRLPAGECRFPHKCASCNSDAHGRTECKQKQD